MQVTNVQLNNFHDVNLSHDSKPSYLPKNVKSSIKRVKSVEIATQTTDVEVKCASPKVILKAPTVSKVTVT